MSKFVLDIAPSYAEECPFYKAFCDNQWKYAYTNGCACVGGYSDSRTFDFEKCPYCVVLKND